MDPRSATGARRAQWSPSTAAPMLALTVLARLREVLSSRRMPGLAAVVAAMLSLPALRFGLVADDYWHRAFLRHDTTWVPVQPGKLWLFTFADGDVAGTQRILEAGFAPWWFSPGLRIAFFRPLASLTHVLDEALWPSSPALMHAQSILWYVALVAVVARLYRRIVPSALAAGLAGLMYAVDHTHGLPVGWLANRNALVAATFAFASLAMHHEAAERRSRPRAFASAGLLALALCGGESASAVLGFFVSHALFLDARPLRARLVALAPHAAVLATWIFVYRAFHFGVQGSGIYVDPLRTPAAFLRTAATSLPLLLASELGGLPPDPYPFASRGTQVAFVVVAVVVLAWSAVAIVRLLRSPDANERSRSRFFALGAALALLPSCATFPNARLTLIPGLGLLGLVAMAADATLARRTSMNASGVGKVAARSFTAWATCGHLLLSPIAFEVSLHSMTFFQRILDHYAKDVPTDPSADAKRLVVVNAPETAFAYYLVVDHLEHGEHAPHRFLMLAGANRDVRVTRDAERSLRVHVDQGFYRSSPELLFRSLDTPMTVGAPIRLSDVTITVTKLTDDRIPEEVRFDFVHALDSDAYVIKASNEGGLVPFVPPAIGETVTYPGRPTKLM